MKPVLAERNRTMNAMIWTGVGLLVVAGLCWFFYDVGWHHGGAQAFKDRWPR